MTVSVLHRESYTMRGINGWTQVLVVEKHYDDEKHESEEYLRIEFPDSYKQKPL